MKRKIPVIFLLLFICLTGLAQKPEDILNRWSEKSPIEKVYLHFDRENYIAGETAWFKAYLYADYLPDTISTNLYVELLNESSVILSQKILPVYQGNTNGQFELPDSLKTGHYFIRAYSSTMLNQDADFVYQRSLFIYGKKNAATPPISSSEEMIRLEFFPESGNFIAGLGNTIAFKATNENGLPVSVSGNIKNEKNETLTSFDTYHDGMGMFDITPMLNEKYYAVLNNDTAHKYYLPQSTEKGIVFRVIPAGKGKVFEIMQQGNDPSLKPAYMIGQMQHHVVFKLDFPQGKENISGTIDVSHLSSGILQITIFSKDNVPLAERLSFVNNEEYIQHAELVNDSFDFSAKKKNSFNVLLKDTVQGSFSVSITDPDYNINAIRTENILSGLLLTDDLKGYIHEPAYYFSANNDSVINALDLVMMINGWRRFKWSNLLNNTPATGYRDPGYISIGGQINIQDTKKYFADKPFIIFISSADSSKMMRMGLTDNQGYFRFDSLLFFGQSRILFKDTRGKKSDPLQAKLSGDSLSRVFHLPPLDNKYLLINQLFNTDKERKLGYDYDAILKAEGLTLAEVIIKAKKKNPVQELEDKYASGLFSGFSERTIDLVNTKEPMVENNIFDYLQYRVPGLNISKDGLDYIISYRQVASLSSMGIIPMTLYLNEIETDASFISTIPANEIAMVKVYSSFVGAVGNGAGGALAIYTKKGADQYNSASSGDIINYRGYSIIKEFYSPDYTVDPAAVKKTDNRITLLWIPNIVVSGINAKIPVTFFNNDRTKQFKIVVEGMTNDGKMLMMEKTIGLKAF